MIKYEEIKSEVNDGIIIKRTNEDGSFNWIPCDESNSDYQAYLEHEASFK
jgi:hypothetical protein